MTTVSSLDGAVERLALSSDGFGAVSPLRKKKSIHDVEDDGDADFCLRHPEVDAEDLRRRRAVFDYVFSAFPECYGKQVSRKARDARKFRIASLVYGEITYASFYATLRKVDRRGIFYDLGSGAGKPVVAAATMGDFQRCVGLEYLDDLVSASAEAKERFDRVARDRPKISHNILHGTTIDFFQADITDLGAYDWSDGDVLFANSTCFDESLMKAIADAAKRLKKGTTFITFTKRLPSPDFDIVDTQLYQMSWGGATVFIQTKTTDAVLEDDKKDGVDPVSERWLRNGGQDDLSEEQRPETTTP